MLTHCGPQKGGLSVTWKPVRNTDSGPTLDLVNGNLHLHRIPRWFPYTLRFKRQWSKESIYLRLLFPAIELTMSCSKVVSITFHFQSLHRFLCRTPGQTTSYFGWVPNQWVLQWCAFLWFGWSSAYIAQTPTGQTKPIPLQVILPSLFPQL